MSLEHQQTGQAAHPVNVSQPRLRFPGRGHTEAEGQYTAEVRVPWQSPPEMARIRFDWQNSLWGFAQRICRLRVGNEGVVYV